MRRPAGDPETADLRAALGARDRLVDTLQHENATLQDELSRTQFLGSPPRGLGDASGITPQSSAESVDRRAERTLGEMERLRLEKTIQSLQAALRRAEDQETY